MIKKALVLPALLITITLPQRRKLYPHKGIHTPMPTEALTSQ